MTRRGRRGRGLRREAIAAAIVPGLLSLLVALAAEVAMAQAPGETRTFEYSELRFAVALPAGCRHEEGPGTIDAVCAEELDPERSARADAASSLVLSIAVEKVAEDAGRTPAELQLRHGEAAFRSELPEAVCGETDKTRVSIGNVKEVLEETQVIYTAEVVCREVRFLYIGERRALVRHVIGAEARYRLVARVLAEDFDRQRETIDAFFASFRVLPAVR